MRAIRCHAYTGPNDLRLEQVPDPVPGAGQVLIKVEACGLGFVDGLHVQGKYQVKIPLPFTPGSEAAGRVIALGAGAEDKLMGKRVAGFVMGGGLAEKALMMAGACAIVPENFEPTAAAAALINYGTAIYGFEDCGDLKAGESVLVLGASGGVGSAAVQMARAMGATVIAAASSAEKLKLAEAMGASHLVNYATAVLEKEVAALTGGRGVDLIVDPVGWEPLPLCRCVTFGGRILMAGFAGGTIPTYPANRLLLKGASLVGVRAGEAGRHDPALREREWAEIEALATRHRLHPIISERLPLADFRQGLARLQRREAAGRIVLIPG